MKNSHKLLFVLIIIISCSSLFAQEFKLIPDKKGTFKTVYWKLYSNNFTQADINNYLKKIAAIPEILRKNSVFANPLGFDCEVDVHSEDGVGEYGTGKVNKVGYGFPSVINFHFLYFFVNNKGKEVRFNIEPPHFDILVNRMASFANGGPLTRNGDLFFVSTKKETIKPGIDRYDNENIILYNPNRPPYFLPVTIREVFEEMINYYKTDPDKISAEYMLKVLEDEYALYSEEERSQYAYHGGRGPVPLSNVNTEVSDLQLMRVNPKYWNGNLPKSAIQTLIFKKSNDNDFLDREISENLKNGSGYYYINKMVKELDIESLLSVIEK